MPKDGEEILKKLKRIKDLPTIPDIIVQVMKLIRDPDTSITDVTQYIEEDPVITAKVLQIVNSPLYRGTTEITSLNYAASRLGLTELEKIVLSLSLMKDIRGMTRRESRLFWRHCVSVALMSDVVNSFSKNPWETHDPTKDDLFVGGLLHDIGLLVLRHYFNIEYEQIIIVCEASETNLYDTEKELLGTTHAEIGAILAKNWNIPESVVAMIAYHHEPERAPDAYLKLAQIVNIADFICNNQGLGFSGEINITKFSETAWWQLGLKIEDVPDMLGKVKEKSSESQLLTSIGIY